MSVIIHDLELLVEPPPPPPPSGGDGAPAPPPPPRLRALDLREAQAQQARRAERLSAH